VCVLAARWAKEAQIMGGYAIEIAGLVLRSSFGASRGSAPVGCGAKEAKQKEEKSARIASSWWLFLQKFQRRENAHCSSTEEQPV